MTTFGYTVYLLWLRSQSRCSLTPFSVEGNNNLFEIRPANEFSIRRGRRRLQALPLLAKLNSTPVDDDGGALHFGDPQTPNFHCVLMCARDPKSHAHPLRSHAWRQWLLRPSCSRDTISTRHNTLACFLSPDNLTTVELMLGHLASFSRVPRALARLRSGKAGIRDWHALVQVGSLPRISYRAQIAFGSGFTRSCFAIAWRIHGGVMDQTCH